MNKYLKQKLINSAFDKVKKEVLSKDKKAFKHFDFKNKIYLGLETSKNIKLLKALQNNEDLPLEFKEEIELRELSKKVEEVLINSSLEVLECISLLTEHSSSSHLIGGSIRDILLGKAFEIHDYDFVTDIPYDELRDIFEKNGFKVDELGKEFLVMKVTKNSQTFDIANYRNDGTYKNGRHPTSVDIASIEEDAQRRDFTINALYFNINTFEIDDATLQGIDDIKTKTLRFVGNPKDRLQEDLLRGWRFMRFINTLGLTPHKDSWSSIKGSMEELMKCDSQRVLVEMIKIVEKGL